MANRAKHAFGSSERVLESIANGVIDSYDILFLDGDTDNPKIGWVSKDGKPIILKDEKADLTELEAEIATKANAKEVDAKIGEIETVLDNVANASHTHEKIKYEIADVPTGTLVNYHSDEIRILCPESVVWTKQSVGEGGDPNRYYATFKTFVPNDNVTGYIEHLGDQVDEEILTSFNVDEHGRRYQPTWLPIAKYDETTDTWTYYGINSSENKMIGWDYQIDWYDDNGVMIASDSIRINLSNESCHSSIEPYYVGKMMTDVESLINEKISEVNSSYEIVEF